jgi:uncharacterized protein
MSRLPDTIDPWRAAESGRRVAGRLPLAAMPRLAALLAQRDGEAEYVLTFSLDAKRRPCIRGTVVAGPELICQRCLEPMRVSVRADLSLLVVQGYDEAAALPEQSDPLLVAGDSIRIADLIEDEIILALPQVPMHDEGDVCTAASRGQAESAPVAPLEGEDASAGPFQVLQQLKSNLH